MRVNYLKACLLVSLALLAIQIFSACSPKSGTSILSAKDQPMPLEKNSMTESTKVEKSGMTSIPQEILGEWDYTAFGTPLGDIPGKINLTTDQGALKGIMTGNGMTNAIQNLKSEGNQLSGHVFYSDVKVNLNVRFEGENLMGELEAVGTGNFKISGKKAK